MATRRVFKPLKLDEAVAAWVVEQSPETVANVERAGVESSKARGPHEWDLADFDRSRLRWVLEWLPQAPAGPRLAVLKRLGTVLRDPRLTKPLLSLLPLENLQPIEHALVLSLLEQNADQREASLAEQLGVSARLETLRRESEKWLRFAAQREAMLTTMFARPDDLELRMVTADWLSGFGDPLGELMSLQLSGAGDVVKPRVAQLMETFGAVWCADLFAPEPVRELAFEQGVPTSISVPRPIRFVPACATLRSLTTLSNDFQWLSTSPWKRVRLVRPIPVLRASELDARIEDVVRFDEFEIFEQHQSGEHSKLLAYRDGRLVLFTTREKVPGFWKTVSARLPTRPVKWVVPTTSSVTAPSGVEVEVLPPAQVHELMLREAKRLERLPVTTSK
jgi:uncharacterized protein (TIGR02996 family)